MQCLNQICIMYLNQKYWKISKTNAEKHYPLYKLHSFIFILYYRGNGIDVAIFGPFKSCVGCSTTLKRISIYDIPEITNFAYKTLFTIMNILSGFKSTGIWPKNLNIFDENDYLASRVSHEPKFDTTSINLRHPDLFAGKDMNIQESVEMSKNVDQLDSFLTEQVFQDSNMQ